MSSYQTSLKFGNSKKSLPVYQSKDYDNLYSMGGLGIKVVRERNYTETDDRLTVSRPDDLLPLLRQMYSGLDKEHFNTFILNARNIVEGVDLVSIGSLNASLVHPREVYRLPIILSAASIICSHNHPSGDPTPSREDIDLTRRLVQAGDIFGIEVLDHLIFAGNHRYLSMKEAKLF